MTDRLCGDYPFTLLEAQLMSQYTDYLRTSTAAAPIQAKDLPAPPEIPPLPRNLARTPQEVVLFQDEDVIQALKIFDSAPFDRIEAMRGVLLFALRVAAINLGVR